MAPNTPIPISLGGTPSSCTSTLVISPATALYSQFVPAANMVASQYLTEGRNSIVVDFNSGDGLYSRDIGTMFAWGINNHYAIRVWQPSIIPMPEETFNRPSDWDDGGTPGNKFIQGVIVEADSFNSPKSFVLQSSDDLSLHPLNETPVAFVKQTTIAFSCVTPFVSHSVRLFATDGVAWRVWKNNLVFEPWPEMCTNWQSEQVSFGLTGWIHAREMNISYASTPAITIVLVPDSGPTMTLTLPGTGSPAVKAKTKLTLPPNKFKLISVRVFGPGPFFLWQSDMEMKVKPWGSTGAYNVLKVVGGPSKDGAGV